MSRKKLILLVVSLLSMTVWGCSSNMDSGGDQTGVDTTLASAQTLGISNCLTCHSAFSTLVQDYLVSRHGNHVLAAGKLANDTETPLDDPYPGSCNYECHDPFNDGANIDLAEVQAAVTAFDNGTKVDWTTAASIIGCEACHGGGQYHNGIKTGIPYATPGPNQCGECHYLNDGLAKAEWIAAGFYPHHTTSSSGNNVRRNISDSHFDDPATSYVSQERLDPADPLYALNVVEGYAIRYNQQNGCVDCHFLGHKMNLTKNYQWAASGHAGGIKTLKDAALASGVAAAIDSATRLQLLADVTAAGPDKTETFPHYDWDNSDADLGLGSNRSSCQMCHTATGAMNFLNDPANYDAANNDFSHLEGWTADHKQSGQNELLYCWACHSDSDGNLRNPGAITLSYEYNGVPVTLPDVNGSNVCVNCHGGRGNNDDIRSGRSSRAASHHAPTAGNIFAAVTHSGYEFDNGGVYLDYSTPDLMHDKIAVATGGDVDDDISPCVNCHMGGSDATASADLQNHNFAAAADTAGTITAIPHLDICNNAACHTAPAMSIAVLQGYKDGFAAAFAVLEGYVDNTITNYLDETINKNTPSDIDYGAWQNYKFMSEEPCSYVHNSLYAKRLIFDSIDRLDNGALTGTINLAAYTTAAAYLNGAAPVGAVARP